MIAEHLQYQTENRQVAFLVRIDRNPVIVSVPNGPYYGTVGRP